MRRALPSAAEAASILAARRTRPARRPPPTAGRALASLIRTLDGRFGRGAEGLAARWSEIVGQALARRSEPVRVLRGRADAPAALEVRVDGPSATLVAHQAPDILARVNLFLGPGTVDRLRIVQAPLRGPAVPERKPPSRPRAARLDAAAEAQLRASLSDFPEGRLKRVLEALGRRVLAER